MKIFYMLYLALVTYLLAMIMPESQGRWSALSKDIVSLISYVHSMTSPSADACWLSPFGTDGACRPLDLSITPTSTLVPSIPATRTVSAITASPIAFNPVLYKDMFAVQLEITKAPRNPKKSKSKQGGIPRGVESPHLLDLLTTVTSTMIILQLFTVLGQPVVGYLESSDPIPSIPNDLEFHPPVVLLDGCHSLIPSWISTTSSLIHVDSSTHLHNDDGVNLKELFLWGFYFSTILVRSCSKSVISPPPPPTETQAVRRLPLVIETSASEVAKVLSICWFRSHTPPGSSSGLDGGSETQSIEGKLDVLSPVLELNSTIKSQVLDAVHSPASSTISSLHLVDNVDDSGSEITDPDQPENPVLSFLPETRPSTRTELSHQHLSPDVSELPLVRSFERISGRRVTPLIQLEHGQVDGVGQVRSSLSLLKVVSMDSLSLGEYDLSFLSQFPAPPKKVPVRSHTLLEKVGIGGASFLRPSPSPTQDSISGPQEVRSVRHLPVPITLGSTASLASKVKRDFSIYHRSASKRSQISHSVVIDPVKPALGPRSDTETTSHEGSPVPNVGLPIPSAPLRWSLFAKKSKQKLRKASSLFTSLNSFSDLHEKVNTFPKTLSRQKFGKSEKLSELPDPPFNDKRQYLTSNACHS